jgi:predicted enzyme related to lactoylglutathione lyase
MAQLGSRNVAGMAKLRGESPFPPMWSVYLAADDADEIARRVGEAGGHVVMPPMDVMEEGRMAYFADPTGAHFGVWQARRHKGAQVVEEPGAMAWHEVYTRDATRARAFYRNVFGLEEQRMQAPDSARRHRTTFNPGARSDRRAAGSSTRPAARGESPPDAGAQGSARPPRTPSALRARQTHDRIRLSARRPESSSMTSRSRRAHGPWRLRAQARTAFAPATD